MINAASDMGCVSGVGSDRQPSARSKLALECLVAPSTIWGDEWLHAGVWKWGMAPKHPNSFDRDELVFLFPGNRFSSAADCSDARTITSMDDAIEYSLITGINAGHIAPQFAYAHELFAIAAWYGILATGRSAWMPKDFSIRMIAAEFREIDQAINRIYRTGYRKTLLMLRAKRVSRRIVRSASPGIVRGLRLPLM